MGNCCVTGTNLPTNDLRQSDEKHAPEENYRRESHKKLEATTASGAPTFAPTLRMSVQTDPQLSSARTSKSSRKSTIPRPKNNEMTEIETPESKKKERSESIGSRGSISSRGS